MIRCAVLAIIIAAPCAAAQQDDKVLGKKSAEWLTILKDHKETKWRRAALIALEVFGARTRGVLPAVLEALDKDKEPEVRREAALLLGRMGPDAKEAVGPLADALKKDKADGVREAAAIALGGKLNEFAHDHVLVLAGALKDAHAGTRGAAAEALRHLGEHAKIAVPQLVDVLKDAKSDRLLRLYAIQMVSRLHEEPAEKSAVLLGVLSEPGAHLSLRVAAVEGIGRAEQLTEAELKALGPLLKDKATELRRAAAGALARHGEQAGSLWSEVQAGLRDEDSNVRYQLLRVAGALAGEQKEAIAALVQAAVKDEHVENRLAAIGELGQLGAAASGATEALSKIAAGDARAAIRDAASAALKRISGS
jgi:HEAT repeat protein